MKITIEIPNKVAKAIIERSKEYAKELGRELSAYDKDKLVGAIMTEMLSEEHDPYQQRITDFDNWVDAMEEGDDQFTEIVKKHSIKI